jgi:hypothetical protein
MAQLHPCPDCARHVRAGEAQCPFCGTAISAAPPAPAVADARLGRAARMAVGAAVTAVAVASAGCGSSQTPSGGAGPSGTATDTATETAPATTATATETPTQTVPIAKPYGAPPADGLLTDVV